MDLIPYQAFKAFEAKSNNYLYCSVLQLQYMFLCCMLCPSVSVSVFHKQQFFTFFSCLLPLISVQHLYQNETDLQ